MSGVEDIKILKDRISQMEMKFSEPMSDDAMAELLEKYGEAQSEFEAKGGYDLDSRAKEIISGLGFSEQDFERQIENFSGGWKMRAALAKILLLNPEVIFLDEPTNHLDLESIIWLEDWLRSFKGTLVLTSHDRVFMNKVANKVVEIAHSKMTLYSGDYEFYLREREIRKEQLVAQYKRQQAMLQKEEEFIAKFAARASHAAQVQSRVKKLEKIERIEIPPEQKIVKFGFKSPPRSGENVVEFNNLFKTWKSEDNIEKEVLKNISGLVRRLDKIALIGVNGAGKSTLLKLITEETDATSGLSQLGASLEIGYFSQHALDVLDPGLTILETLQNVAPLANVGTLKTLLGSFLFSDEDVDKKISVLSGGEKSRVVLATILIKPVNFLVLDEPTNHLDIVSREILMDALNRFEGTIIMVSHDRHFLSSITNRVFRINDGEMSIYEGGFKEYLNSSFNDEKAN
jgi:ATP-binding cassette subfamily F protein 3